jgi:predicted nucleic acid-binding protein
VVSYVLDASAILRYLDKEEGAIRVAQIFKGQFSGRNRVLVSAIHWGEVAGVVYKRYGGDAVEVALSRLLSFGVEVIPATAERAVNSALIKARKKIPYADAFAVDLAADSSDHVLLTADFDVEPARHDIAIEFISVKSKPN